MSVGTKLEVVKIKFSEMERVDATEQMEIVGLSNGKNARTSVASILSKVTKDDVGLGKVQNLAPDELPVSTATQEELDKKLTRGEVDISDINGLQAAIDSKLDKTGTIEIRQVNGLENALDALAPSVVQGLTDW